MTVLSPESPEAFKTGGSPPRVTCRKGHLIRARVNHCTPARGCRHCRKLYIEHRIDVSPFRRIPEAINEPHRVVLARHPAA